MLAPLWGERPDTKTPGVIRGALRDGATGLPVAAKIRVTDMPAGAYMPEHAIKTMPQKAAPGVKHYFYPRGKWRTEWSAPTIWETASMPITVSVG